MSTSLYRAYRPQKLSDVVGQQHVVTTIMHAIEHQRIAHAYLFCGPRGTGKTTMARLLAKALLCEQGPYCNPCGTCSYCKRIARGEHPDVIEIDAASRTGVDSVRSEIISRVQYAATEGAFQVFIIDEAHMLSTPAFNALLKTLEEPPAHVVFILCTTDPQQVIETVRSRCQRFDFKPLSAEEILNHLRFVCTSEGFDFEEAALNLVAQHAKGGMRDALSTLEQLAAFGKDQITLSQAQALLGTVQVAALTELVEAVAHRNVAQCFALIDQFVQAGQDLMQVWHDLSMRLRDLYIGKVAGDMAALPHISATQYEEFKRHMTLFESTDRLVRALSVLSEHERDMRTSTDARLTFELCCARLARPQSDLTLDALAERVAALEAGQTVQVYQGTHDIFGQAAAETSKLSVSGTSYEVHADETTSSQIAASSSPVLSAQSPKSVDAGYTSSVREHEKVKTDCVTFSQSDLSVETSMHAQAAALSSELEQAKATTHLSGRESSISEQPALQQSDNHSSSGEKETSCSSAARAESDVSSSTTDHESAAFRARLESYWGRTAAALKAAKPAVGAMIEKAYPTLEGQTLVLTIDNLGSFQKMLLARKENHQLLVDTVRQQFLRDFDVEVRAGTKPATPVKSAAQSERFNSSAALSQEEFNPVSSQTPQAQVVQEKPLSTPADNLDAGSDKVPTSSPDMGFKTAEQEAKNQAQRDSALEVQQPPQAADDNSAGHTPHPKGPISEVLFASSNEQTLVVTDSQLAVDGSAPQAQEVERVQESADGFLTDINRSPGVFSVDEEQVSQVEQRATLQSAPSDTPSSQAQSHVSYQTPSEQAKTISDGFSQQPVVLTEEPCALTDDDAAAQERADLSMEERIRAMAVERFGEDCLVYKKEDEQV